MQAALRAVYGPRFPARARLATLWATVGGGSAASDGAVPAALAVRPLSVAELCELRHAYVLRSAAVPRASLALPARARVLEKLHLRVRELLQTRERPFHQQER